MLVGFDAEFSPKAFECPPAVFSGGSVWEGDFAKQHSPPWWRDLFQTSGLLDVLTCTELEDGLVLLEDKVLHDIEYHMDPDDVRHCIEQIAYGREHSPHQTLFAISARRC